MRDWRPDWKNADSYIFPSATDLHQWAWEFMRRCPDYEREYERLDAIREGCPDEVLEDCFYHWVQDSENRYACSFRTGARNTADNTPPIFTAAWLDMSRSDSPIFINPTHDFHVSVRYNLTLPIEEQLRYVQSELRNAQSEFEKKAKYKTIKKLSIPKFPLYIRLIDAIHADASSRDIAKYLYCETQGWVNKRTKQIADNKNSAIILRDYGFRQIPYLRTKRPRGKNL